MARFAPCSGGLVNRRGVGPWRAEQTQHLHDVICKVRSIAFPTVGLLSVNASLEKCKWQDTDG